MGGKKSSENNRRFEKDRRDKLNAAFEELCKLLPDHDPSSNIPKIEILKKAAEYIRHLKSQNEEIINSGTDTSLRHEYEKLKKRVTNLIFKTKELVEALRSAGVPLPVHKKNKKRLTNQNQIGTTQSTSSINSQNAIKKVKCGCIKALSEKKPLKEVNVVTSRCSSIQEQTHILAANTSIIALNPLNIRSIPKLSTSVVNSIVQPPGTEEVMSCGFAPVENPKPPLSVDKLAIKVPSTCSPMNFTSDTLSSASTMPLAGNDNKSQALEDNISKKSVTCSAEIAAPTSSSPSISLNENKSTLQRFQNISVKEKTIIPNLAPGTFILTNSRVVSMPPIIPQLIVKPPPTLIVLPASTKKEKIIMPKKREVTRTTFINKTPIPAIPPFRLEPCPKDRPKKKLQSIPKRNEITNNSDGAKLKSNSKRRKLENPEKNNSEKANKAKNDADTNGSNDHGTLGIEPKKNSEVIKNKSDAKGTANSLPKSGSETSKMDSILFCESNNPLSIKVGDIDCISATEGTDEPANGLIGNTSCTASGELVESQRESLAHQQNTSFCQENKSEVAINQATLPPTTCAVKQNKPGDEGAYISLCNKDSFKCSSQESRQNETDLLGSVNKQFPHEIDSESTVMPKTGPSGEHSAKATSSVTCSSESSNKNSEVVGTLVEEGNKPSSLPVTSQSNNLSTDAGNINVSSQNLASLSSDCQPPEFHSELQLCKNSSEQALFTKDLLPKMYDIGSSSDAINPLISNLSCPANFEKSNEKTTNFLGIGINNSLNKPSASEPCNEFINTDISRTALPNPNSHVLSTSWPSPCKQKDDGKSQLSGTAESSLQSAVSSAPFINPAMSPCNKLTNNMQVNLSSGNNSPGPSSNNNSYSKSLDIPHSYSSLTNLPLHPTNYLQSTQTSFCEAPRNSTAHYSLSSHSSQMNDHCNNQGANKFTSTFGVGSLSASTQSTLGPSICSTLTFCNSSMSISQPTIYSTASLTTPVPTFTSKELSGFTKPNLSVNSTSMKGDHNMSNDQNQTFENISNPAPFIYSKLPGLNSVQPNTGDIFCSIPSNPISQPAPHSAKTSQAKLTSISSNTSNNYLSTLAKTSTPYFQSSIFPSVNTVSATPSCSIASSKSNHMAQSSNCLDQMNPETNQVHSVGEVKKSSGPQSKSAEMPVSNTNSGINMCPGESLRKFALPGSLSGLPSTGQPSTSTTSIVMCKNVRVDNQTSTSVQGGSSLPLPIFSIPPPTSKPSAPPSSNPYFIHSSSQINSCSLLRNYPIPFSDESRNTLPEANFQQVTSSFLSKQTTKVSSVYSTCTSTLLDQFTSTENHFKPGHVSFFTEASQQRVSKSQTDLNSKETSISGANKDLFSSLDYPNILNIPTNQQKNPHKSETLNKNSNGETQMNLENKESQSTQINSSISDQRGKLVVSAEKSSSTEERSNKNIAHRATDNFHQANNQLRSSISECIQRTNSESVQVSENVRERSSCPDASKLPSSDQSAQMRRVMFTSTNNRTSTVPSSEAIIPLSSANCNEMKRNTFLPSQKSTVIGQHDCSHTTTEKAYHKNPEASSTTSTSKVGNESLIAHNSINNMNYSLNTDSSNNNMICAPIPGQVNVSDSNFHQSSFPSYVTSYVSPNNHCNSVTTTVLFSVPSETPLSFEQMSKTVQAEGYTADKQNKVPEKPYSVGNQFKGDMYDFLKSKDLEKNVFMPITYDDMRLSTDFSSDLFSSLQVPSGGQHPESISPTAAFLLAFPLVSTSKNVESLHESEQNENQTSTPTTILQIGNIEPPTNELFHTGVIQKGNNNKPSDSFDIGSNDYCMDIHGKDNPYKRCEKRKDSYLEFSKEMMPSDPKQKSKPSSSGNNGYCTSYNNQSLPFRDYQYPDKDNLQPNNQAGNQWQQSFPPVNSKDSKKHNERRKEKPLQKGYCSSNYEYLNCKDNRKKKHPNRISVNWMSTPENRDITDFQPKETEINPASQVMYSGTSFDFHSESFPDLSNCNNKKSNGYSWSPSKSLLPSLDSHLMIPSTLPTLVGDLALGTTTPSENYKSFEAPKLTTHPPSSKKPSDIDENKKKTDYSKNQVNLFSVSHLVEAKGKKQKNHDKNCKKTDRNCKGKNNLNYSKRKDDQYLYYEEKNAYVNNTSQFAEKRPNFRGGSYSAESLIGPQNQETEYTPAFNYQQNINYFQHEFPNVDPSNQQYNYVQTHGSGFSPEDCQEFGFAVSQKGAGSSRQKSSRKEDYGRECGGIIPPQLPAYPPYTKPVHYNIPPPSHFTHSHSTNSTTLTNFNLSTIFPEMNDQRVGRTGQTQQINSSFSQLQGFRMPIS